MAEAGGGGSDANSSILTATSSFSSTLSPSPSDLDTESIASFFPERVITLGSLIGIARGMGALQEGDRSSRQRASTANRANYHTGSMSAGSTASSQGISCSHMSRICENINLWSLLPCGACICADKGIGKGICCADKADSCVAPSETGLLSSSLARFLMAERDADRDAERSSNGAKVYINIMYEECHRVEDAAVNPLFDLDASPGNVGSSGSVSSSGELQSPGWLCTQSPRVCQEAGVMLSCLCTDNETCMVHKGRMAKDTSRPLDMEVRTPSVRASKEHKGPDMWDLGCVSYMCTRCRF